MDFMTEIARLVCRVLALLMAVLNGFEQNIGEPWIGGAR